MSDHTVSTTDTPLSSVEISSRAKGPPGLVVKVYHADPDTAAREALRIYVDLEAELEIDTTPE